MTENNPSPASSRRIWLMAGALGVIVALIAVVTVRQQLRRPAGPPLPVLYGITDFRLTNQLGRAVTLADLRGKVSVVNVIFTRCPGPCLTMSRQYAALQNQLPGEKKGTHLVIGLVCGVTIFALALLWGRRPVAEGLSKDGARILAGIGLLLAVTCLLSFLTVDRTQSVRLVSLTVDPEFDTPGVLKAYGDKLGTDAARWWFLTGSNAELRRVAIDDFKFVAVPKDVEDQESKDDLFIHATYFMVLDGRGRVRAVIESAEPGAVEQTLETVARLQTEL